MLKIFDNKHKQILIILMAIAFFVLLVSLAALYTERVVACGTAQTCTIPLPFLIPIIASVSLFVGALVNYLMTGQISKKDKDIKTASLLLEKILNKEEYAILKILSTKKQISQSKIVMLTELPRLKVFRIIEGLKRKGVLEKEIKEGKLRMIKINPEFEGLFRG